MRSQQRARPSPTLPIDLFVSPATPLDLQPSAMSMRIAELLLRARLRALAVRSLIALIESAGALN
jgi:hypothetical protein